MCQICVSNFYFNQRYLNDGLKVVIAKDFVKATADYPYSDFKVPLVFRADWFIRATCDSSFSNAYEILLYSQHGKRPKTKAEFLKAWNVKLDNRFQQAHVIEGGQSGVVSSGAAQLVVYQPGNTWFWESFDNTVGVGRGDALAQLDGKLTFDGQEIFAGIQKIDLRTRTRSAVNAYLLVNGQGNRVAKAPVDLVTDSTGGVSGRIPEIVNPVSCHVQALIPLPGNAVRETIESRVEIISKAPGVAEGVERLYLGALQKAIKRNQEDYGAYVSAVCDLEPAEVVGEFGKLLAWYEKSLSLEQAAIKVGAQDPEELRDVIR